MKKILLGVAIGGAAGSLLRFAWQQMAWVSIGEGVTWGVNILGCFLLAWFSTFLRKQSARTTWLIPLLTTGFCGAFTTFSTWCKELFYFYEANGLPITTFYFLFCLIGGLLGIVLGHCIGNYCVRKELSK